MDHSEKIIADAITTNNNRISKLLACKNARERREKAKNLVIAECAAQKLRLTADQIIRVAVHVVNCVA